MSSKDARGMDAIKEDLLTYVRGLGRIEYTQQEIAEDLANLGKHGGGWALASALQWSRTIDTLLADGSLRVSSDGFIRLPVEESDQLVQGSLFDGL